MEVLFNEYVYIYIYSYRILIYSYRKKFNEFKSVSGEERKRKTKKSNFSNLSIKKNFFHKQETTLNIKLR